MIRACGYGVGHGKRLVTMDEQLTMQTAVTTTRTTAVAVADQVSPRPIVAVLGMHRSGTSLCAHVLSCLGIDMADELLVNSGNTKGHWERLELVALHDRMLALCNRAYFTSLHDLALPEAWWADPQIQTVKREILGFLQRRIGSMPFGFKDPRTARLLPVWNQIFRELNLAPKFVLCLRNPAQVARSVRDRDHLDPQIGEYRWFVYLTDILQYIGKQEFCLIEYEDWFNKPGRNLGKLQQFLEIEWPGTKADLHLTVSEIIDGELRHDDPRRGEAREPTIRAFYELVRASTGDSAARQRTRYLTTQFAAYRSLQRPFERAFENAQALANKVAPLEQEIARLQTSLGERDAEIARLGAPATAAQAELTRTQTELAARAAALADAERTAREALEAADRAAAELTRTKADLAARDAALAEAGQMAAEWDAAMEFAQADLARVQAELAARDATLADAERTGREAKEAANDAADGLTLLRAELAARDAAAAAVGRVATERAAAVECAQAEVVTLHDALVQAERVGLAQTVAADTLRTEVVALWDTLEQAENETQQRDAVVAAMQAEVAAMRERVAQAEREAQQGGASAATAQAEVAALQETLTQAEVEVQQRAAMVAILESEVAALRERLAQTDRKAQQRAAAEATLEAEIVALQSSLIAARQVGKTAIAALQIGITAPSIPDEPRGWRYAVMWFFGAPGRISDRASRIGPTI